MRVENWINKNNRVIPNQFIIYTLEATYFQSYNTIIAKITHEEGKRKIYLDETSWDYSKTTSKYRNEFLGEDSKTIKNKINLGEYILIDLNE